MKSKYKYTVNTSLIHDIKNLNIQRIVRNLLVKITFASVTIWRSTWQPTPALVPGKSHGRRGLVGFSPWGCEESDTTEWLHFHFHALEKEMATLSSVFAWRIPGTGEPGGLPSMGLHKVGHDWSDLAAAAAGISLNHFWLGHPHCSCLTS